MEFNLNAELTMILRAALATIFGILIGIERQKNGRVVGIRTFAAIALGTSIFTLMATVIYNGELNPTIIGAIIIAVGIISAKMMVVDQVVDQDFSNIAAVWTTAAISICLSYGLYVFGGAAAAFMLIIFWFKDLYIKN